MDLIGDLVDKLGATPMDLINLILGMGVVAYLYSRERYIVKGINDVEKQVRKEIQAERETIKRLIAVTSYLRGRFGRKKRDLD